MIVIPDFKTYFIVAVEHTSDFYSLYYFNSNFVLEHEKFAIKINCLAGDIMLLECEIHV